jgi:myxalamid-type polyketide synthase MxaE and MxaD
VNPNPLIPFEELRFSVRCELGGWPCETVPLVAGVSGFGFGGTNAHVVLQEAPPDQREKPRSGAPYLLPISARTPDALQALAAAYRDTLLSEEPGDICYTASVHRTHHNYRLAVVGDTKDALIKQLDRKAAPMDGMLAFVFSGQGSHWISMGLQLYDREPVFRAALNECHQLFREHAPWSLIEEISRLHDTATTQPAIFAIQVSLTALWKSWGIVPDMVAGHSLGEVAAAYAAEAISLQDAVRIVFHRSRLMTKAAGKGKTAVVGLPLEEAQKAIAMYPELAVAGSNSPTTSVLAGETSRLGRVLQSLETRGVFCRLVPGVDIAFHSPQMDSIRVELVEALCGLAPRAASIPIISTVTGSEVSGQILDAEYWGRNLREHGRLEDDDQSRIDAQA